MADLKDSEKKSSETQSNTKETPRRMGMQTMKIALDTNVLIYFLEGIEPQASKVEKILNTFMKTENEGIISTVTIAEALTGFYLAGDAKRAAKAKKLLTDLTLNSFKIVPVTLRLRIWPLIFEPTEGEDSQTPLLLPQP